MRRRRRLLLAVFAAFLCLAGLFVWEAMGWPPLRVLLTVDPVSGGAAESRFWDVDGEAMEFVRVEPGYMRVRRGMRGTALERLLHGLGIRKLAWMGPESARIDRYVWVDRPYWISRRPVWSRKAGRLEFPDSRESRLRFATVDEVYLAFGSGALHEEQGTVEQALRDPRDRGSLKWVHAHADPHDRIYWRIAFREVEGSYGHWPAGRLVREN